MLIKINDNLMEVIPVKNILLLQDFNIIGFTNNSKTFTLELVSERLDNIRLMGTSWSEYLKMIKYTRQILKKYCITEEV